MDQTITTINATEDFLKSQIIKKDEYIKQLESAHANAVSRSTGEAAERNIIRNEMHEWTLEALEHGTIDESTAEEIANICGFQLTREVEVTVVVEYTMTLQVPAGEDEESIVNDIDFDAVAYDLDRVSYVSSTVTDLQI
jgi:hypothetical protein